MCDFQAKKYFFWGAAGTTQYGLYSPVLSRIILTDGSASALDRLEYVAFLLSSKIELFVVPLHEAINFRSNLIDNQCCEHWNITDWPPGTHLSANYFRMAWHHRINCCGRLWPNESPGHEIQDLKSLAWLAYSVIDFFKFGSNVMYTKFYDMITVPLETDDSIYAQIKLKERLCFDTIYHSASYHDCENTIEHTLNDDLRDLLMYHL